MQRRFADLSLSLIGWAGFNVVMVWAVAFLSGVVVSRTVDAPVRIAAGPAVIVDVGLLVLFAVQHSLMARHQVKSWLRRRIPQRLERTTYVLATDVCLALLLWWWQPWGGPIWHIGGPAAVVVWAVFAGGWVLAVASTYAIDHLELTGLRQAGWTWPPAPDLTGLQVGGLYSVVRHPLMTGILVAFWATPDMGAAHLLLAVCVTLYIALGVHFEERDLRRTFGTAYDDYATEVPALIPGRPRRWAR